MPFSRAQPKQSMAMAALGRKNLWLEANALQSPLSPPLLPPLTPFSLSLLLLFDRRSIRSITTMGGTQFGRKTTQRTALPLFRRPGQPDVHIRRQMQRIHE